MRLLRILLVAFLVLPAASLALTRIDNVRVYRAPDYTRFVFDVSEPPAYQVLPEVAPGRLVIDFRDAEMKADLDTVDLKDSPVRRVRSGTQPDSTTRVVFDLAVAVRVKSFTLAPAEQYGHRLVVDLYDQAVPEEKPKTVADYVDRTTGPRKVIVAIDAGHGGEDPGAHGLRGTREKDVVLAIARAVRDQMQQETGMKPVMIRDGDYYVGLKERRVMARKKYNADMFVSVHADAFTRRDARGASVFAVSRRGATSNTAAYLAEAENRADQVGGVDPQSDDDVVNVISDLIMEGTMSHSLHVGRSVLDQLGGFARLHKGSVEQAGFMVLKEPNMPSILVETGFISNPDEERLLKTAAYQQRLAKAIVGGVRNYFERYPPPGTLYAAQRDRKPVQVASAAPATRTDAANDDAPADLAPTAASAPVGSAVGDAVTTPAGAAMPASATTPVVVAAPVSVAVSTPASAPAKPALAKNSAKSAPRAKAAPAAPAKVAKAPPAKPAPAAAKQEYTLHKVRKGQSLGWLANKYGVTQRAIKDANGLKRDNLLIGETLKIPKS